MTEREAIERATRLWPDIGALDVRPMPGDEAEYECEWLIESSGRPHILDHTGKPTCHGSCIMRWRLLY